MENKNTAHAKAHKVYKEYDEVLNRAGKLGLSYSDRISMLMDLEFSNIDVEKLLTFDDFNFAHDIFGMKKHFNRVTKQFDNCFLPRANLKK